MMLYEDRREGISLSAHTLTPGYLHHSVHLSAADGDGSLDAGRILVRRMDASVHHMFSDIATVRTMSVVPLSLSE